jgi:hypothetical protein
MPPYCLESVSRIAIKGLEILGKAVRTLYFQAALFSIFVNITIKILIVFVFLFVYFYSEHMFIINIL